jgi:hypothetical protein
MRLIIGTTTGSMGDATADASASETRVLPPVVGIVPAALATYGYVKRKPVIRNIGLVWCAINLVSWLRAGKWSV